MNVKSWLKVVWVNKRSGGKVWLKGKPFQNADQTSTFLAPANKANIPKIRGLQQVHGAKDLGTNHLYHPGHVTHPSWCSSCQEMWIRKRMWSRQKKVLIKVIIYSVCFEQEEAWYLLIDDNAPEAMRRNSSGQADPDLVLFCHWCTTKPLVGHISWTLRVLVPFSEQEDWTKWPIRCFSTFCQLYSLY